MIVTQPGPGFVKPGYFCPWAAHPSLKNHFPFISGGGNQLTKKVDLKIKMASPGGVCFTHNVIMHVM